MTADFCKSRRVESRLKHGSPHHPSPHGLLCHPGMAGSGEGTLRCCCGLWREAGRCGRVGTLFSLPEGGAGCNSQALFLHARSSPLAHPALRGHLPLLLGFRSTPICLVPAWPDISSELFFFFFIKRHPCAMKLSKNLSCAVLLSPLG